MKSAIIALLGAAIAVVAEPYHNHHGHQHLHEKRDATPTADVVVPGPTVVVYELNGVFISASEVQEGINNGTLVYAPDGQLSSAIPSTSATPSTTSTSSTYVAPTTTSAAVSVVQDNIVASSSTAAPTTSSVPSTSSTPAPTTSSSSSSSSAAAATSAAVNVKIAATTSTTSSSSSSSTSSSSSSNTSGLTSAFPNGELDCTTFPSAYGAVNIDWLGLGGWTGIQIPGTDNDGYSNIVTQDSSTCSGDSCCTEGAFCSYACPPGYQKSQWPSTQGATGQSVGGIECLNGKLWLTNSALSSDLCIAGASEVTIEVVNNLSENVAVCRTDYPGTESMTIPVDSQPGTTEPLTCPNAATYYTWEGGSTSAQYYVNPAGVSVDTACQWGTSANNWGNFAPLNIGVGYSSGAAWLSIFQNSPTTDATLDFAVEITGSTLSGSCKYSNGQYCSSTGCSSTSGCTVSLTSGTAQFVFSSS